LPYTTEPWQHRLAATPRAAALQLTPRPAACPGSTFSGTIGYKDQRDVFSFSIERTTTITASAAVTAPFNGVDNRANLDARLQLLDRQGRALATADPASAPGTAPGSLSASLSATIDAGQYYLAVSGTGWGDPLGVGYSSYGSLGAYSLSLAGVLGIPVHVTTDRDMGARCQPGPGSATTLEAAWHSDEESLAVDLPFDFLWGSSNIGRSAGGGIWVRTRRCSCACQLGFCRISTGAARGAAKQYSEAAPSLC
jgi:hypothetical protein